MIHVVSKKPSAEECKSLARITISSRRGTPLESSRSIEEMSEEIEKASKDGNTEILTALDDEGNVVGWIHYYVGIQLMAFIEGFLPVVDKDRDSERIASALIEAAKRGAVESGHNRLEVALEFPTDKHREYSENLLEWYKNAGFHFAAEEAHMTLDLGEIDLPSLAAPEGYELRAFSAVASDPLEDSGLSTFRDSRDELFLSLSDDEQEVTMRYFFDRSKPFAEEGSLILERDGQVIGFVITRLRKNEAEIGPVGVVPEARGKGLAEYLFVRALEGVKNAGINTAFLDVSIANQPARKLYEKYGFKKVLSKQFHYWTP